MNGKKMLAIGLGSFVAGAVVATRFDPTVWAAIAGSVCGLVTGIFLGAMAMAYVTGIRQRRRDEEWHRRSPNAPTNPILVVSPPQTPQLTYQPPPWTQPDDFDAMPIRRIFNVIGDGDGDDAE